MCAFICITCTINEGCTRTFYIARHASQNTFIRYPHIYLCCIICKIYLTFSYDIKLKYTTRRKEHFFTFWISVIFPSIGSEQCLVQYFYEGGVEHVINMPKNDCSTW